MQISDRKFVVQQETDPETAINVVMPFRSYFPEVFPTEETVREYIPHLLKNGSIFAAYRRGEPLGFITGYTNDHVNKRAYVTIIAVKQGLGLLNGYVMLKLLDAATQFGLDQGMEYARLEVYDDNTHAAEIYRKLGFQETGRASDHSVYMEMRLDDCRKAMRI